MKPTVPESAVQTSTLTKFELKSAAAWIASEPREIQQAFLESLSEEALRGLPWLFEFWALPHQLPPKEDWRSWVILGGRGAGKTRAGAEWVRSMVEGPLPKSPGKAKSIGLIGETIDQAREVMVFGESGLLACSPPDRRPKWHAGRRLLEWPNGAKATVLSGHDPEGLRGYQFDAVWVDELAKWKRAKDSWQMLMLGLRLGDDPRACVTTTPRSTPMLRALLERPSTAMTHAPTYANAANLARGFLEEVHEAFKGTRLGRQELDGALLDDVEGALWSSELIEATRVDAAPELDRIVVAVDPPVTGKAESDECGIVVAGVVAKGETSDWQVYVLEDASVSAASPMQWAEAAVAAFERHNADRLVAEVNQGGDLVQSVINQIDPTISYTAVRATRGKAARAEPVAALYEQKRVHHLPFMDLLEDQMAQMTTTGFEGQGSPDRVDALVWALTELVVDRSKKKSAPNMRFL